MKNKKIRVGIDVDNVVLDFTGRFIDCFFKKTGIYIDRNDINTWNFKDYIDDKFAGKIDGGIVNEMLLTGELVTEMDYKLRSKEALIEMNNHNNIEIVFVTALHKDITHLRENWFKEHLNDLNYELHFESKKSKIKMDYLIDDGIHNLDELSKYIPTENCLCIKEPYNNQTIYPTFNDLYEAYEYILEQEGFE